MEDEPSRIGIRGIRFREEVFCDPELFERLLDKLADEFEVFFETPEDYSNE
jgi:hypothetical protein